MVTSVGSRCTPLGNLFVKIIYSLNKNFRRLLKNISGLKEDNRWLATSPTEIEGCDLFFNVLLIIQTINRNRLLYFALRSQILKPPPTTLSALPSFLVHFSWSPCEVYLAMPFLYPAIRFNWVLYASFLWIAHPCSSTGKRVSYWVYSHFRLLQTCYAHNISKAGNIAALSI